MVLDPTIENKFSVIINGTKCVGYRFSVYDAADALVEKASIEKTLLETPLYNDDLLEISVAADVFTAGNEYKWQITLYAEDLPATGIDIENNTITCQNHNLSNGDMVYVSSTETLPAPLEEYKTYYVYRVDKDTIALFEYLEGSKNDAGRIELTEPGEGEITVSSVAVSDQIPFTVYNIPTITLTTGVINSRICDFVPVYTHPQRIPVNHYRVVVYDGNIISEQTENIYSSNMKYRLDGLIPNQNISIEFIATNDIGQVCSTGKVKLTIQYDIALLDLIPEAINNYERASVDLNWGKLVQIIGKTSGRIRYLYDFMKEGNIALKLYPDASLVFEDINISAGGSPPVFLFSPEKDFSGVILRLDNSQDENKFYEVGYDGSRFYRRINGLYFYESVMELKPENVYLIACLTERVYVKEVGMRTS